MISWWPFSSRSLSGGSLQPSDSPEAEPLTATIAMDPSRLGPFSADENDQQATSSTPGPDSSKPSNDACSDPELAISPKSIQMLEEAEMRVFMRYRNRRMLLGTILAIIFFIVVIATVLCPREANFNLQSFDIDEENPTFRDGEQLMTNWISKVAVDNRNFYPIDIREIKVTAYLERDRRAPIGKGAGGNLYFPARSLGVNEVKFQMPVYAPSTGMPSLIAECMSHDKVDLFLRAELDLAWTHWSGRWISMEFFASIDCKVPAIVQLTRLPM